MDMWKTSTSSSTTPTIHKPPIPRPTTSSSSTTPTKSVPIHAQGHQLPLSPSSAEEPCSPTNNNNVYDERKILLSKSLGSDAFGSGFGGRYSNSTHMNINSIHNNQTSTTTTMPGGFTMPLHRQISEVASITHAGYLYKRSNKPDYQQVLSPFPPLDSLEIITKCTTTAAAVNNASHHHQQQQGENTAIETELVDTTPSLGMMIYNNNHYGAGAGETRRPLNLNLFPEEQHEHPARFLESLPMAPLLTQTTAAAPEITESISTKASNPPLQDELGLLETLSSWRLVTPTTTTTVKNQRQLELEESLNGAAAFFGINVEDAFHPPPRLLEEDEHDSVTPSTPPPSTTPAPLQEENKVAGPKKRNINSGRNETANATTTTSTIIKQSPTKPVPIHQTVKQQQQQHQAVHRRCSAPSMCQNTRIISSDDNINNSTNINAYSSMRSSSRPPDYHDPKDHHLWRARYCLLEEGVLYFYRSKEDAESQYAKEERKRSAPSLFNYDTNNNNTTSNNCNNNRVDTTTTTTVLPSGLVLSAKERNAGAYDLSKSPMASRSCLILPSMDGCGSFSGGSNHSNNSNSNSDAESNFCWEKRVALNCVGAVRSAETEYGKNAFELLAVADNNSNNNNNEGQDGGEDDDDDNNRGTNNDNSNKLVLKAPRQEEMNEWIFQFHRSLASFVMNMVDLQLLSGGAGATTPSPSYALGDIHHPSFEQHKNHHYHNNSMGGAGGGGGGNYSIYQSPLRSFNVPAFSPRIFNKSNMLPGSTPVAASLSHGHGRSQRRRRRAADSSKNFSSDYSIHSVPSTPTTQSPTQLLPFPFSSLAAQCNLVTPLKHGGGGGGGDLMIPEPEVGGQGGHRQQQQQQPEETTTEDLPPELSAPQSANPPETERPPPLATGGKYRPPHLRKGGGGGGGGGKYVPPQKRTPAANTDSGKPPPRKYVPPHQRKKMNGAASENGTVKSNILEPRALSPAERERVESTFASSASCDRDLTTATTNGDIGRQPEHGSDEAPVNAAFKLGGCADPLVIRGSILDQQYIDKKASRVGPVPTDAYGSLGGRKGVATTTDTDRNVDEEEINRSPTLEWEIGAVSECGIRESNEDAYFVTNDLVKTFSGIGALSPTCWDGVLGHGSGVFAIFDGHCGNQAARFAAERLPHFLYAESLADHVSDLSLSDTVVGPKRTEDIMRRAILKLDEEFCRICVEDGREWESGSTALVAMIAEEHLVIANIGDCRGVLCRTFDGDAGLDGSSVLNEEKWNELLVVDHAGAKGQRCFWREVAEVHSPSRQDEKERIERAGGWTTTETEIPISQLQRMDFLDQDVIDILRRCFQDRIDDSQGSKTCSSAPQRILQISRVCGELAVSRAIGDRDFKAACNLSSSSAANLENDTWECSLLLTYPDEHSRKFVGDLVTSKPEFKVIRVGENGIQGEFLVLACDGLWDVMDKDDAVRVTWDLLFEKKCPAKQAAARLAELAIHLGSSDNITVIIVRFFAGG